MAAALNYISRMTDRIFERQMARAARKISASERRFQRGRR